MASYYSAEDVKKLEGIMARGVILAQSVEWMAQEAAKELGRPVTNKAISGYLRQWKHQREQRWREMLKESEVCKCDAFERLEMMYREAIMQKDIKQAHLIWRDMTAMLEIFESPTKKSKPKNRSIEAPQGVPSVPAEEMTDEQLESLVDQEGGSGGIPAKVANEIVRRDHER